VFNRFATFIVETNFPAARYSLCHFDRLIKRRSVTAFLGAATLSARSALGHAQLHRSPSERRKRKDPAVAIALGRRSIGCLLTPSRA
jgi:hypothetical protein